MINGVENDAAPAPAAGGRSSKIAAVLVAAGRGERAGRHDGPKQYRSIGGRPIIARTLHTFASHPAVANVALVIHRDDEALLANACGKLPANVALVHGGATRQESVRLGLHRLAENSPDAVLIQDAVRPFTDGVLIDRVVADLGGSHGVLPAVPVAETLKREAADGTVFETVARGGLHAAQTPQGFPFRAILDAHDRAHAEGRHDFTDDAGIAEWAGISVRLVAGSPDNVKITWQRDIELADLRLRSGVAFPDVRTGNGYDVHAFAAGDHVMLCGVAIPHDRRLLGHSDADVALHALTDALLATCGAGDIGTHFPPSDPQWRGAASRLFVEHAVALVRARGGRIANADVTLIAEGPKVGSHRAAMTASLSDMLSIEVGRVSVKATTNERLGFIGRNEGIAAIATATVVYPGELPE
jgi:2-C-methyl-D-erythritol 4-phosphate cytidylyltransferase / 2-C-methyl-D-erythritol 2,4-cyclodiphosphate synthase